ncbi:aldose epimerase [Parenemella sanctibonifatiensis]|uniref:Aldose epimerase n=2 Tax=Parenemella sanctibonifatiensis TaxID=2016505 RepID=A0A255EET5_9ACTN|nr:aldose epimerase [Parenemella sanctibonifatiensis]
MTVEDIADTIRLMASERRNRAPASDPASAGPRLTAMASTPFGSPAVASPDPRPTGAQYAISHGDHAAVVTEQGATLRAYAVAGRPIINGFGEDQVPQAYQGMQLMPWPNRIRDGRWQHDGATQQLAISEPDRATALHGLVNWPDWTLLEHTADTVSQRHVLRPQQGWPGTLVLSVRHRVNDEGLRIEVSAENIGSVTVPFGYAAHPYFAVGDTSLDHSSLSLPADQYLVVDAERLLPIELAPVTGEVDLRAGEPLGARTLDTAYTGLATHDGVWTARLDTPQGRTEIWAGAGFDWSQVYTSEDRQWLAVEPMTCGPDGFNGGQAAAGLITLEPGAHWQGSWGIRGY